VSEGKKKGITWIQIRSEDDYYVLRSFDRTRRKIVVSIISVKDKAVIDIDEDVLKYVFDIVKTKRERVRHE